MNQNDNSNNNGLKEEVTDSFIHDRYVWERAEYPEDEELKQGSYSSQDPDGKTMAFILASDEDHPIDDESRENAKLFKRDFGRLEVEVQGVFGLPLALDLGEDHIKEYMTEWEELEMSGAILLKPWRSLVSSQMILLLRFGRDAAGTPKSSRLT